MHIIDLTVKCKQATGDGTKIVCMNDDYVVRVTAEDCGTFTDAPKKQLIVRHGMEYHESDIEEFTDDNGNKFLGAELPLIDYDHYVDLGLCGKDSEGVIIYTSTSARYECAKSALNGVVVKRTNPVLKTLNATTNGTYKAVDSNADGFYEVEVNVAPKIEEYKRVDLDMSSGDQTINPTNTDRTMSQVTIYKPMNLIPSNIKEGVNIAGVVGTLESKSVNGVVLTVTSDTTTQYHTPDASTYYSQVQVNPIPLEYIIPTGEKLITTNGDYDVTEFKKITVAVEENEDEDLVTAKLNFDETSGILKIILPEGVE